MPKQDFTSSEAILLRKFPYKEAGAIFTLFTRKYGLVDFIGKGVYSSKNSKMASALEAANLIEIQYFYREGRSLQIPKRVILKDDFHSIKENYDKFFMIAGLFKEIRQIMAKEDPHRDIFIELKAFLKLFGDLNDSDSDFAILKFKIYLLEELGYLPDFKNCSRCKKAAEHFNFSRNSGSLLCDDCRGYDSNLIELDGGSIELLRNIRTSLHIIEERNPNMESLFAEILEYIHSRIR
ncbi:MAG: DNA repair protein RecO [Candidatus Zixiibacteriota bacterium]